MPRRRVMRLAGALRLAAALALLACARPASAADHVKEGICPSLDIRNSVANLQAKLRGCRVIEGHLSIVVMERPSPRNFENISFPELREITGYLKIYRLQGLRNLGDLFPNLSVVRGLSLFKDYAIIIYDSWNLQALGLRSLERVERGAVRIERNDRLCYVNSIDWSRIVVDGVENNVIRKNYDPRLCGLCPNAEGGSDGRSQALCPTGGTQGHQLCWDERHCQKICPGICGDRSCTSNGTCCHPSCVGGCDGPEINQCHVCRYFSLGYGANRTCVEKCPVNTYELFKRCVSEQECLTMPAPVEAGGEGATRSPKIFNNTCIFTCPSGYMEKINEYGHSTCMLCPSGGCVRYCKGSKIDAVATAEQFKGCTHITGNLEISLRSSGGNTMAELEASLGGIREIEGSLRVLRSDPLVSLTFFKSLARIRGQNPEGSKKQTLYIFNNANLELLWNWTTHGPIEITQGKLFIHFNPKLCYGLIAPLQNMTRDPDSKFEELEVSKENNGDRASCFQETLHLTVQKLGRQYVILTWNMYCLEDFRKLLGYSIYYIVAEHNITQYERRDACYDSWNVLDKTIDEVQNASAATAVAGSKEALIEETCNRLQPLFSPVTQLRPFTRYAAYVKTYTTEQDKRGAQSPIIYFKTLPGKPSPPQNLQADVKDAHTAQLRWTPPLESSGALIAYRLEIQANMYNHRNILQNNYCINQVAFGNILSNLMGEAPDKKKVTTGPVVGSGSGSGQGSGSGSGSDESCPCRDQPAAARTKFTYEAEYEQAESIDFENALQNEVYHKAKSLKPGRGGRSKRSSHDNWLVITSNISDPVIGLAFHNETDADGYVKTLFMELLPTQLNLTLGNLRHFTSYTVAVWACRQRHPAETQDEYTETWYSARAVHNFLTNPYERADVVSNLRATALQINKTLGEVSVTWDPPHDPNGLVVAYTIQHVHAEDSSQTYSPSTCLGVEELKSGAGYVLRKLAPGNYSVKVAPVSLAGLSAIYLETFVTIPERKSPSGYEWVWGVIGGCLLMSLVLGGGAWFARRSLLPSAEANKLFASVNPEYVSTVYVPDEWEVPRTSVQLVKELGQGSFGMVYEGIAKEIVKGDPETRCAVKTVNEHATDRERIEFLNEASVMKAFDTHHVVRLLGVVSRGQPTLVVMELMARGDLKSYLRSHRPDAEAATPNGPPPTPPSLQQIYQMAIEIADGMSYLSAKKFVHRDLAARNCMVADDLTVKVGDFGMTRDIYETDYYRKGSKGLLPVRWMSPESLKDGVFSSNSDVWSYGVVLWEMATLAMQPYQGLSNEQVLRYVVEGGVMERPEHCPDRLYELMRACWAHRPASRPPFTTLVAQLAPTAAPYFRHRSFFHTQQGQEIYAQQGIHMEEEPELTDLNVGAVATGSGSNLFGVSGRLASWVRELSSLRSRHSADAAAEPLAPAADKTTGPNGVIRDSTTRC